MVLVARHGILAGELGHPGPQLLAPDPHLGVRVQHILEVVLCSAPSVSQSAFTITEKAQIRGKVISRQSHNYLLWLIMLV